MAPVALFHEDDVDARHNWRSPPGEPGYGLFGWTVAYAILAWCTRAYFMADTVPYVSDVYLHDQGIDNYFWDFRHLFWRPLGWVLLHLLGPLLAPVIGREPRITVLYIFIALNCVCGLFSLFLLRALLRRFRNPSWTIEFCSVAFVFSFAFLNYIHAGSSYVPGLMFLLLGLYLVARSAEPDASPYLKYEAALVLAVSVCLWFPYAFAVPGALALPFFYPNRTAQRWPLVLLTTIICLFAGLFTYGLVLAHLRLYTVAAILHWVAAGASDVAGVRGANRAIFGFAHSFIDLGKDGVLFKRFLLHDPYNPVSVRQLFRLSLWKLAVFYALLLAVVVQLARSAWGRNILAICAVSAGPVFVFALFWFGGDIERYLPLYPMFFLALSCAVADDRRGLTRALAATFLILAMVANLLALSRHTLQHQQQMVVDRIEPLLPLLKSASRVVEVDIHDDLVNFSASFPLNPINRSSQLRNYPLLNPGTPQTRHWRQAFAATVLATWNVHADVWISQRFLALQPSADWGWIEKSDPNVTWKDLHTLFSQFDFGPAVGGSDGFLLLLPTQKNLAIVNSLQSIR